MRQPTHLVITGALTLVTLASCRSVTSRVFEDPTPAPTPAISGAPGTVKLECKGFTDDGDTARVTVEERIDDSKLPYMVVREFNAKDLEFSIKPLEMSDWEKKEIPISSFYFGTYTRTIKISDQNTWILRYGCGEERDLDCQPPPPAKPGVKPLKTAKTLKKAPLKPLPPEACPRK
jgi:hypothetical protein